MAKYERKLVDRLALEQMPKIEQEVGWTTTQAKSLFPEAVERGRETYRRALEAAGGLAEYGGISPEEASKMEIAATRGVRGVYDVLGAEARRRQAITGGYGGFGEYAKMARQVSQAEAEALTGAKAEIARLRVPGRIQGTEQLVRMYGLTSDQANEVLRQILAAQSAGIQLTQSDIEFLAQMSKQPSGFFGALQGIGQAASGIGGLIAGIRGIK